MMLAMDDNQDMDVKLESLVRNIFFVNFIENESISYVSHGKQRLNTGHPCHTGHGEI